MSEKEEGKTMNPKELKDLIDHGKTSFEGVTFTGDFSKFNFSDLTITGCNFVNLDLSDTCWNRAQIRETSIQGSDLARASFLDAGLTATDFSHTELGRAVFNYSTIYECNFSHSYGVYTSFQRAKFGYKPSTFQGCSLHNTDFSHTYLVGVVFLDSRLNGSTFQGCTLDGLDLSSTVLKGATLSNTSLVGTKLEGAGLYGTCFSDDVYEDIMQVLQTFLGECPLQEDGTRIVYRTANSIWNGDTKYEPGNTYTAPIFSRDILTGCHPGIYAGSERLIRDAYSHHLDEKGLVKCSVHEGKWLPIVKGCIRCQELTVLEIIIPAQGEE